MSASKIKRLFITAAAIFCMAACSFSAIAADDCFASDESGETVPGDAITSISVDTEEPEVSYTPSSGGDMDTTEVSNLLSGILSAFGSESLTPNGNLTLVDDIYRVERYESEEAVLQDKQFITVETKNGNIFYLIIDRSGDTENVYFLNMVDEADLLALLEDGEKPADDPKCLCDEKCRPGEVNTDCPVCKNDMSQCTGEEQEPEPPRASPAAAEEPAEPAAEKEAAEAKGGGRVILLLVVVLGGVGFAVYRFVIKKRKPSVKGGSDLDNYDFGDDGDEEPEYDDDIPDSPDREE